ncbi:trihelix transcription factor GT-2-like [Dorcoceras hygrometricum]|uniref:Trihelix transcription factor GT-2-like n=1 Tax=Dorcoceras hygrometricum TaxID=472368 RepID=A0A2Z7B2Z7_9LAMI|nr:trihelix transcription factor GT-2-like [Dorcoceras hygrometricum]
MLGGGGGGGGSAGEESGGGDVGASTSVYPSGGAVGEVDESIRMEETERGGGGGNRWPRQETLALLKIRSDMDSLFRDSNLKGPLWDEVSRKMGELGFQRSAKKCKEKFENVFKYHKRTKDGRASKPEGKSYRFFDQLAALETTPPPPTAASVQPMAVSTVTSTLPGGRMPQITPHSSIYQLQVPQIPPFDCPTSSATPTSDSTSSDDSIQERRRVRKRKRKWKDFFGRLMADVIQRQQELQRQFLETLDKRETDRAAREEARRNHEIDRISREHDLLVQERSAAAAKDAALIGFLQKITEHNLQIPSSNDTLQVQQLLQTILPPPPPPPPAMVSPSQPSNTGDAAAKTDNSGDDKDITNHLSSSSTRWPKAETEALIQLRTNLDLKYQDSGAKGPLWEEVSAAMAKIGYHRSSKRCKEKWENINKYFKKVKESNKKRPDDSKTCPYFQQLDVIYRERAKHDSERPVVPIMAMPEQQWPLPEKTHDQENDNSSENIDESDDGGGSYEMITNKINNPSNAE